MIAGFRVHEAPQMGDNGGDDSKGGSSQLLGVLDFCHLEQM